MTILDDLNEEAIEIVRRHDSLAELIGQHRNSIFQVLGHRPHDRDVVQKCIELLSMTDMKGYFRDRIEYH